MKKLSNYVIYFILYSFIGWLYEVFLEAFVWHHGFVNRGVLYGPWLPVYGFGALLFLVFIYPLIKDKPMKKRVILIPAVFLGCMFVATALELLTSYICEWTIGSIPWDYFNYKINFQGRIALSTSIRFGLGGLLFLYILQPLFEKLCDKLGKNKVNVAIIILIILAIDLVFSFIIF